VLDAADITVRFGALVAVDKLSLAIGDGEVVGLVGPNGSGKSTFINAVTGLVPAAGSVHVDGKPVRLGTAGYRAMECSGPSRRRRCTTD